MCCSNTPQDASRGAPKYVHYSCSFLLFPAAAAAAAYTRPEICWLVLTASSKLPASQWRYTQASQWRYTQDEDKADGVTAQRALLQPQWQHLYAVSSHEA
jgi:hypothetical protein